MMHRDEPQDTLLEKLAQIKKTVEELFDIALTDQDFADGREELLHIYCHETCHAVLAHAVPWLGDLPERDHIMVDEVLVRLLEKELAPRLGLFCHSDDEFLVELSMYPVDLERTSFERLSASWETDFWPRRDLAGMAVHALQTFQYGDVIYHILPRSDWKKARKDGAYRPASLESQGFIHFSRAEQVLQVAANFYRDLTDLVLLTVAVDRLESEPRYEDLLGEGKLFPHFYGPLTLDTVVAVDKFEKDADGNYQLPQIPSKGLK